MSVVTEPKYNFKSERQDYLTPQSIYNPLLKLQGLESFDIDVCCTLKNIPAKVYFQDGYVNGLNESWSGVCWMNPEFKHADKWVKKAYEQVQANNAGVWSIIPARTETVYWHNHILSNPDCFVVFLKKGVQFLDPETKKAVGVYKNPLAIVYFGKDAKIIMNKWIVNPPMEGSMSINPSCSRLESSNQLALAV